MRDLEKLATSTSSSQPARPGMSRAFIDIGDAASSLRIQSIAPPSTSGAKPDKDIEKQPAARARASAHPKVRQVGAATARRAPMPSHQPPRAGAASQSRVRLVQIHSSLSAAVCSEQQSDQAPEQVEEEHRPATAAPATKTRPIPACSTSERDKKMQSGGKSFAMSHVPPSSPTSNGDDALFGRIPSVASLFNSPSGLQLNQSLVAPSRLSPVPDMQNYYKLLELYSPGGDHAPTAPPTPGCGDEGGRGACSIQNSNQISKSTNMTCGVFGNSDAAASADKCGAGDGKVSALTKAFPTSRVLQSAPGFPGTRDRGKLSLASASNKKEEQAPAQQQQEVQTKDETLCWPKTFAYCSRRNMVPQPPYEASEDVLIKNYVKRGKAFFKRNNMQKEYDMKNLPRYSHEKNHFFAWSDFAFGTLMTYKCGTPMRTLEGIRSRFTQLLKVQAKKNRSATKKLAEDKISRPLKKAVLSTPLKKVAAVAAFPASAAALSEFVADEVGQGFEAEPPALQALQALQGSKLISWQRLNEWRGTLSKMTKLGSNCKAVSSRLLPTIDKTLRLATLGGQFRATSNLCSALDAAMEAAAHAPSEPSAVPAQIRSGKKKDPEKAGPSALNCRKGSSSLEPVQKSAAKVKVPLQLPDGAVPGAPALFGMKIKYDTRPTSPRKRRQSVAAGAHAAAGDVADDVATVHADAARRTRRKTTADTDQSSSKPPRASVGSTLHTVDKTVAKRRPPQDRGDAAVPVGARVKILWAQKLYAATVVKRKDSYDVEYVDGSFGESLTVHQHQLEPMRSATTNKPLKRKVPQIADLEDELKKAKLDTEAQEADFATSLDSMQNTIITLKEQMAINSEKSTAKIAAKQKKFDSTLAAHKAAILQLQTKNTAESERSQTAAKTLKATVASTIAQSNADSAATEAALVKKLAAHQHTIKQLEKTIVTTTEQSNAAIKKSKDLFVALSQDLTQSDANMAAMEADFKQQRALDASHNAKITAALHACNQGFAANEAKKQAAHAIDLNLKSAQSVIEDLVKQNLAIINQKIAAASNEAEVLHRSLVEEAASLRERVAEAEESAKYIEMEMATFKMFSIKFDQMQTNAIHRVAVLALRAGVSLAVVAEASKVG